MLRVENLAITFTTDEGNIRAVDGVSFHVSRGETLGVVGESGCGKSVTALSIMRLIDPREGRVTRGRIIWKENALLDLSRKTLRRVRGGEIAMVFQDPFASLNPVYTIGNQLVEAITLHQGIGRKEAQAVAVEALQRVHIPSPATRLGDYPHQISGGMQQRVMIAMALACSPDLLIADEPTTALDVTIQSQILELLREIQSDTGMALILISHDLGVVAELADRIAVMYAGKIVEEGSCGDVLFMPRHPYTEALLRSLPRLGTRQKRLNVIPGRVPDPLSYPPGCRFHPRCGYAEEMCACEEPLLRARGKAHNSACHFAERVGDKAGLKQRED